MLIRYGNDLIWQSWIRNSWQIHHRAPSSDPSGLFWYFLGHLLRKVHESVQNFYELLKEQPDRWGLITDVSTVRRSLTDVYKSRPWSCRWNGRVNKDGHCFRNVFSQVASNGKVYIVSSCSVANDHFLVKYATEVAEAAKQYRKQDVSLYIVYTIDSSNAVSSPLQCFGLSVYTPFASICGPHACLKVRRQGNAFTKLQWKMFCVHIGIKFRRRQSCTYRFTRRIFHRNQILYVRFV